MMPDLEGLAQDLVANFEHVAASLDQRSKSSSRRSWATLVLSALVLGLSTGVVILALNTSSVSSRVHDGQLTACAIANQARAEQVILWQRVIMISSAGHRLTRTQKRTDAQFLTFVKTTFAQLNCRKIYG